MGSVNKVILIGNLGADPEIRVTPAGNKVATLRIATNEFYRDAQGELQQVTEWHRVVCWNRLAEQCEQYLSKGRQVYIEGRIRTRKYTDNTGIDRYITEVIAQRVVFLGSRAEAELSASPVAETAAPSLAGGEAQAPVDVTQAGEPPLEKEDVPVEESDFFNR